MSTLTVENLTHIYSPGTPFEMTAIEDINLEVYPGEFVGIIGQTGSGKSTLIQHLNGLVKPSSGTVLVDGEDIGLIAFSPFNVYAELSEGEHEIEFVCYGNRNKQK